MRVISNHSPVFALCPIWLMLSARNPGEWLKINKNSGSSAQANWYVVVCLSLWSLQVSSGWLHQWQAAETCRPGGWQADETSHWPTTTQGAQVRQQIIAQHARIPLANSSHSQFYTIVVLNVNSADMPTIPLLAELFRITPFFRHSARNLWNSAFPFHSFEP